MMSAYNEAYDEERLTRRKDKNKAAHEKHYQTEYFQALGKAIGDEKLLAGPLDVKTIKPIGGFASR